MKKELKVAISIFAIATAFGFSTTGLMPVLSMISDTYKDVSTSLIQLLQTIPYALIIVGSLIIGYLTTKFTKKKIVLVALLIIGVCGVLPFFFSSFMVLFISRVLIGLGFGIAGPMNTAIISEFFDFEKRAGYMGLHVVGMGAGSIAGNLLGGFLAHAGLRYYYLVYLLAIICAVIVQLLLPETPAATTKKVSDLKITK
ncbi:MAG: MFS transporter, partial [Oscillospiraceae bacterium]|nr:MFS transporter [Oscillospiraceae bacterium]